MASYSYRMKNDKQKGSYLSMIKGGVYAALSYMACAGKTIEPIKMAKMVIIILLLVSFSERVATMARPMNKMPNKMQPPPSVVVGKDARGPVPPYGPSGCTMIPGRKGRKC